MFVKLINFKDFPIADCAHIDLLLAKLFIRLNGFEKRSRNLFLLPQILQLFVKQVRRTWDIHRKHSLVFISTNARIDM